MGGGGGGARKTQRRGGKKDRDWVMCVCVCSTVYEDKKRCQSPSACI